MTGLDSELESIVNGCLKNDRLSQRKLYDKYASEMFVVCKQYANSDAEAEDMVIEGFVNVFKNLGSFKGESPLASWVRSVVLRSAISHYRNYKKFRNELSMSEVDESMFSTEEDEEAITTSLDAKRILDMLQRMPEPWRTVFNLRAVEGCSFAEIGEMLGTKEDSMRVTYLRARKWMMEELRD